MSLAGASGLIGTAVGLAVTVGVLGLAFNFANKAVESAQPRRTGRSKRRQRPAGLFDFGNEMSGKQRRQRAFDTGRSNINNVFSPAPRRRRQPDIFGGNLF